MSIDFMRPEVDELRPRISVIGVGGAGGNAIANMIDADVQGGRCRDGGNQCCHNEWCGFFLHGVLLSVERVYVSSACTWIAWLIQLGFINRKYAPSLTESMPMGDKLNTVAHRMDDA